jgi:hypothetical protein
MKAATTKPRPRFRNRTWGTQIRRVGWNSRRRRDQDRETQTKTQVQEPNLGHPDSKSWLELSPSARSRPGDSNQDPGSETEPGAPRFEELAGTLAVGAIKTGRLKPRPRFRNRTWGTQIRRVGWNSRRRRDQDRETQTKTQVQKPNLGHPHSAFAVRGRIRIQ